MTQRENQNNLFCIKCGSDDITYISGMYICGVCKRPVKPVREDPKEDCQTYEDDGWIQ
jgi:hypothetical protein